MIRIINKHAFSNVGGLKDIEQGKMRKELFRFYSRYCLPTPQTSQQIKKCQAYAYANLMLNKAFFFGGPFCIKYGINMVSNPATISYAPIYFMGYGVCYASYVFFEGQRNRRLSEINVEAMKELSLKTYSHLLILDADYHLNVSSRQSLFSIYKAQKAIEANLRSLNQYFLPLAADILLTTCILSHSFGFPYLATFLTTFGAYSAFTIKFSNFRRKIIRQTKQQEKKADFTISQALQNLFTVKYFNAEKYELSRYSKILNKLQEYSNENIRTLTILNSVQRLILSVGLTVSLLLGVSGVKAGAITAGDLILIQSLMLQLIQPLFILGMMHREWVESSIDMKDLFNILEREPKIQELPNAQELNFIRGNIEIRNLHFQYTFQNKIIFKNLNLKINGGDWILVVGESGVGKSTLFNLIFRLIDPQAGQILIDNQDIKQLKLHSFRRLFGVVAQQSYFFNDTIRNNLMYGLDLIYEMTPELITQKEAEMKILCEKLQLSHLIDSLPLKYDTPMGDQANKFSGGEKQRLQIVRCLLRGAKVLLLDEPTSALDQHNESQFIETLESVLKTQSLTVIIITHRLHLLRVADSVLYLGKENNVEFDKYQNLMEKREGFYKMYTEYLQQ